MPQMPPSTASYSRPDAFRLMVFAATIFVLSVTLYSLNIDKTPKSDEYYHILAARGLLETGIPKIAEGVYERGFYYTWMLSRLFDQFGESIAVGRVPSIVFVALLTSIMFLWLAVTAGLASGLIGAFLFALSPFAIEVALFIRFYALQSLLFFVGVICCSYCVQRRSLNLPLLLTGLISFALAIYFQKTTLIGLLGFAVWVVWVIGVRLLRIDGNRKWKYIGSGLAAFLLLTVVLVYTGFIRDLLVTYRAVPLWNSASSNQFWFYFVEYLKNYPVLVSGFGILFLSALAFRSEPTLLATSIFMTTFVVASFAANKNTRYIVFAQPFFFAIAAIGITASFEHAKAWLQSLREGVLSVFTGRSKLQTGFANTAIVLALMALIGTNPGFARSISWLSNYRVNVNWGIAEHQIRKVMEDVDVVVTLAELETLYYYDTYDILYSPSRLRENGKGRDDFHPDYRTGRPIVASLDGLSKILSCYDSGVVISTTGRWNKPVYMPVDVRRFIIRHTEALDIDKKSGVIAFEWNQDRDKSKANLDSGCDVIPGYP